ncbi:MAG: FecR family protein [Tannerella sp.]|jgi:ferric-dicitrate binding protein FerR (iron transport regulator)|nr:FecR family protein [Tannerella sp.]
MINNTNQDNTIDIAWERIYKRFEQDDLLAQREISSKRTIFYAHGFRWAASIAILCICVVSVRLMYQQGKSTESKPLILFNEMNAPTLATAFEDGSIVYLSEQATIHYPGHFQEDKRMISLKGDAYFEINQQLGRPFVIDTEMAEIEVLGTFFHVKNGDNAPFTLSVRNGEVKVTLKKNNQMMLIKAGETATLASDILQLTQNESHQFANCFNKVRFKDERLDNIVRIINLNTSSQSRIEVSPEQENRLLNCTIDFSSDTPEEMAELIGMALNLTYSKHNDIIYITK